MLALRFPSRPLIMATCALASLTILCLLASAQPRPAPKGATAKQVYKNIKVLTNLPANQLLPTMRTVAASLGVGCDFCHVAGNFAADTKAPKRTARAMILMVNDINKREKVLDHKATCYMCHHGHAMPEFKAPEGERS